ncbi:YlaH-like family protein [Bacillus sp. 1P06AnD]|uniref:YlaH-like family protein n=1 Tax=Bacillus sp. 1P06AnD TaxID=3132208 RepID=UPI0039A11057
MDVTDRLSFFAALFEVDQNPEVGMRYLYVTILVLTIIVYNLGFAKKLNLLQNVIIYVCLALGCTILTFFAAFLPMAEGLFLTALFLGIYRFRLHLHRRAEKNA